MSKARSPRYPQIGLPEAIERVRAVYAADHQNEIPKEVVAAHMGYRSLNGASLGIISAVSKYGLLEGGRDGMRVTDRALTILANEPGDPERLDAIRSAASEPQLFAEIFVQYPQGASDQSLKSFLITRKKFLPSAVDPAIRAFRSTLDFVEKEGGVFVSPAPSTQPGREMVVQTASEIRKTEVPRQIYYGGEMPTPTAPSGPNIAISDGIIRLSGAVTDQSQADYVIGLLTAVKTFLPAAPMPDKAAAPDDDRGPKDVFS